jgi:hypothetical protein
MINSLKELFIITFKSVKKNHKLYLVLPVDGPQLKTYWRINVKGLIVKKIFSLYPRREQIGLKPFIT